MRCNLAAADLPSSLTNDPSYEDKYSTCTKVNIPEGNFDLTLAHPSFSLYTLYSTQIKIVLNYFDLFYQVYISVIYLDYDTS